MRTLYLRNVPDEVVERLETLAHRDGMSVSAYAVRQLSIVSNWAENHALLDDLPSLGITAEEVVADIAAARR